MENIFRALRRRYDSDIKEFSARSLSKRIGLSAKVISVLENKETNGHEPTLTELKAYHKEFNVPFEYLLGESKSAVYEHQTVSNELGLSDRAIETLKFCKEHGDKNGDNSITRTINTLIEEGNTLNAIRRYLYYELCEDVLPFHIRYRLYNGNTARHNDEKAIDFESPSNGFTIEHFRKLKMLDIQECLMKLPQKVILKEGVNNGEHNKQAE